MVRVSPNPPSLPPSIAFLASSLTYTLKDYQNLPLHLAVVYLMLADKDTHMRVSDFKLKRYLFPSNSYRTQEDIASNWNNFGIGFNESYDYVSKLPDIIGYVKEVGLDTKCFFTQPPVNPKKIINYVYSRNDELVEPLNQVVEYFSRVKKNIPYFLIYPYLELNRDRAIKATPEGSNNKYEVGYLRYDKQNHTLKWKTNLQSKKYIVKHSSEAFALCCDTPYTGIWYRYTFTLPEEADRGQWVYDDGAKVDNGIDDKSGKASHMNATFSGPGMVLKLN
jgi:hypothetical protein